MALVTEGNITELAVERWRTAHDPRLAEIMGALVRHLHDFAREVQLTEAEWMAGIQWLTATGRFLPLLLEAAAAIDAELAERRRLPHVLVEGAGPVGLLSGQPTA